VDLSEVDFTPAGLPSANATVSSSKIADIRGTNAAKSAMRMPYDKTVQQRLTLHAVADATGGRACVTVQELEKCFAEAVDDSRSYYLLGYDLGGETQPGWRKIKVTVAQGGLRIRYRSGFYVTPKIPDTPEARRKELVDALASPIEYTGLRLTARLLPPSTTQTAARTEASAKAPTEFMLGVMGDTITIDRQNGNAVSLEVTTLAFDSNRRAIASMSQAVQTKLSSERAQKILETGMGIPEKVELPPGKYEVKFAVRDNYSGLLGTVSVPLEIK
jgi:methionine-rich copper-binding protein CopC